MPFNKQSAFGKQTTLPSSPQFRFGSGKQRPNPAVSGNAPGKLSTLITIVLDT